MASLLVVGASAGSPTHAEALTGSLRIGEAAFTGSIKATTEGNATHSWTSTPDRALHLSYSINAAHVLVNWTHRQATGLGPSSSDANSSTATFVGDPEYGEKEHTHATLASQFSLPRASLLAVASNNSTSNIQATQLGLLPHDGEPWYVGPENNQSSDVGPMTYVRPLAAGSPTWNFHKATASISGDFIIYVWGGTVQVQDGNGTEAEYRSGTWSENYSGSPVPQHVAKEEHLQLLRLHLTDAIFTLEQTTGLGRASGSDFTAVANGTMSMGAATGEIRQGRDFYSVSNEPVTFQGYLSTTILTDLDSVTALQVTMLDGTGVVLGPTATGEDVPIDVTPNEPDASPDSGIITDPSQNRPDAAWLAAAFAILPAIAAGSTWLIMRTRERKVPPATAKIIAEEAIAQNQPKEARRWIRPVLRKDPTDVDAWFTYGASLAQEKRYRDLREELGPRFGPAGKLDSPSVCFLLGLAAVKDGDIDAASQWLNSARRDPVLEQRIAMDPLFSDVNRGRKQAPGARMEAIAYA